jgi:hypothetical protein
MRELILRALLGRLHPLEEGPRPRVDAVGDGRVWRLGRGALLVKQFPQLERALAHGIQLVDLGVALDGERVHRAVELIQLEHQLGRYFQDLAIGERVGRGSAA